VKASTESYNLLAQLVRDQKLLPGNELAEMAVNNMKMLKEEKDPIDLLHLLEAYKRQLIKHIDNGFKARPPATGTEEQARPRALTKIQLRAQQLVNHMKELGGGVKKRVQLTSSQAREYLAGVEGAPVSRRDCLRAFQRACQIFPAIDMERVQGDLRGTRRLALSVEDLHSDFSDKPECRSQRLQARQDEVRMIFFKEGV